MLKCQIVSFDRSSWILPLFGRVNKTDENDTKRFEYKAKWICMMPFAFCISNFDEDGRFTLISQLSVLAKYFFAAKDILAHIHSNKNYNLCMLENVCLIFNFNYFRRVMPLKQLLVFMFVHVETFFFQ